MTALAKTTIPNLKPGESGYKHAAGFLVALRKEPVLDRPHGRLCIHLAARFVDDSGNTLKDGRYTDAEGNPLDAREVHAGGNHDMSNLHVKWLMESHMGQHVAEALQEHLNLSTEDAHALKDKVAARAKKEKWDSDQFLGTHLDILATILGAEYDAMTLENSIQL